MAIKFVSIKCPECGASLDIEEGRYQIFAHIAAQKSWYKTTMSIFSSY